MLLPHGTVFAIVDGEKFELYRNTGMESEPQLTALNAPALEATNYSAAANNHDKISRFQSGAPKDRLDKMEEAAHVTAVAQWLNGQVLDRQIDKLVVVADPKSLGQMRRHYHKELENVLMAEVSKNLAGRPPQEIIKVLHS
ncbi:MULTISPECIES: host attachment protein [Novosphingobium]|jgi:protein required for attachment to host cells|uniref:Protein required for attachment to host cells n=1 Tax=Novosphingobium panipatense TaxID=428991 RepID=A0ABY1QL96_9SPHN|nr:MULTISPECIES: host attachment protein [Novosphingobium]SMP74718.1 Protein required for attachment to host cells [Novosphingobium panipatense]